MSFSFNDSNHYHRLNNSPFILFLFKALSNILNSSTFDVTNFRFSNSTLLFPSKRKPIVNCILSALATIGITFRRRL
ncbi:MAG: hypothetical protein ACTS6G_03195 [Candidatus Hodgkinia cicadicola]